MLILVMGRRGMSLTVIVRCCIRANDRHETMLHQSYLCLRPKLSNFALLLTSSYGALMIHAWPRDPDVSRASYSEGLIRSTLDHHHTCILAESATTVAVELAGNYPLTVHGR